MFGITRGIYGLPGDKRSFKKTVEVKGGPAMKPGRPTPTMKGAVFLSNTAHSVCAGHEPAQVKVLAGSVPRSYEK
jgi:hypothetical protein